MKESVFGFDYAKAWDYENGFYLTSHPKRLNKAIAHYEIYRKIVNLPGQVVECGVFKGASLIRLATFREMLESPFSREIIGFDVFGKFPSVEDTDDTNFIEKFEGQGGEGIAVEELEKVLGMKGFDNISLIKGNIFDTIPDYLEEHPEFKISLLHIDVDVYEPSRFILETLFERVVSGGVIVFDDYGTVAGETRAVDEYLEAKDYQVQKLPISHIPAFVLKK